MEWMCKLQAHHSRNITPSNAIRSLSIQHPDWTGLALWIWKVDTNLTATAALTRKKILTCSDVSKISAGHASREQMINGKLSPVSQELASRPFPSSPGLCIKTRLSAQPLMWKFRVKWFFILMQIKLIFTRKVEHVASFWKRGFLELGSGLVPSPIDLFC